MDCRTTWKLLSKTETQKETDAQHGESCVTPTCAFFFFDRFTPKLSWKKTANHRRQKRLPERESAAVGPAQALPGN